MKEKKMILVAFLVPLASSFSLIILFIGSIFIGDRVRVPAQKQASCSSARAQTFYILFICI